jgi:PPE-repeat protein
MDYGALPPEINSGRMYAGPGTGSLMASAAAWQALAVELGSSGAAFQAVVTALVSGPWLGPSSLTMAASAAPYVVWMLATAGQCQEASVAAQQAAGAFEAARAAVIPPAEIEENRARLAALIATNFFGVNTPAIAATEAQYDYYWTHDATVLYGWAGDASGISGSLAPFTPAAPDTNPAGLGAQAGAVSQSAGLGSGQAAANVSGVMGQLGGMPGGFDAQTMLSMGPQLISTVPQALQGLASPLMSGGGLTQFQSLLSPFMGMLNNPGMFGGGAGGLGSVGGIAALPGVSGGLSGLGGASAAGPVEAVAGRAASLGGLSIPETWTAGAGQTASAATVAAPITASGASASAVPASASGGIYGGAPLAAGMGGRSSSSGEPRYGTPIKISRR